MLDDVDVVKGERTGERDANGLRSGCCETTTAALPLENAKGELDDDEGVNGDAGDDGDDGVDEESAGPEAASGDGVLGPPKFIWLCCCCCCCCQ